MEIKLFQEAAGEGILPARALLETNIYLKLAESARRVKHFSASFYSSLVCPPIRKLGSGFRGLAQDDRGMRGSLSRRPKRCKVPRPKRPAPPSEWIQRLRDCFSTAGRYRRRLCFFSANRKSFDILMP